MKHGRPDKQWYEFCGKQYHLCRSSDGLGWRREHAARVFQAIQVVIYVAILDQAHEELRGAIYWKMEHKAVLARRALADVRLI